MEKERIFYEGEVKALLNQVSTDKISFGKFVELLNDKALSLSQSQRVKPISEEEIAVRFVSFIENNYGKLDKDCNYVRDGIWTSGDDTKYTTQELYQLFKSQENNKSK